MSKIESTLKSFLENYLYKIENNAAVPVYKANVFVPEINTNYGTSEIVIEYFPILGHYTIKKLEDGENIFTADVDKFDTNNEGEILLKQIYKDLMVTETKEEVTQLENEIKSESSEIAQDIVLYEKVANWYDNLSEQDRYNNRLDAYAVPFDALIDSDKDYVYSQYKIVATNPEDSIEQAAKGKKVDERYWVEFEEKGSDEVFELKGSYDNIEDAFERAKEFLHDNYLGGNAEGFSYVGVNGTGKKFAVVHATREYVESLKPMYFKSTKNYQAYKSLAELVALEGKSLIGEYPELAAKGKKIEIKYPTETLPQDDLSIEERELSLYIDNDSNLYFQRKLPIEKNLMTKIARGTFDIKLAPKIYKYLIDDGIQRYNKEFGGMSLTKKQKENLANAYVNEFLNEASTGNYENENYLPKKYLSKGGYLMGKSHAEGGIEIVVPEGMIEAEGGEVIINKEAVKEHCKLLSELNQSAGDGVAFDCDCEDEENEETEKASKGKKIYKKKWFKDAVNKKAPFTLSGWSKDMTEKERRSLALKSRDQKESKYHQNLSAARALQALSNVTKDAATKKAAKKDSKFFFKKASMLKPEMAEKGKEIKNQYSGMTPIDLWKAWTPNQRRHFLSDHTDQINEFYGKNHKNTTLNVEEWYSSIYNELPEAIKEAINIHMIEQQYKKGGAIKLTGPKQTKRGLHNDSKFKAKHAGKRTTKEGSVYYEYRKNRSDKDKRTKL